jgi:hypothetical protein
MVRMQFIDKCFYGIINIKNRLFNFTKYYNNNNVKINIAISNKLIIDAQTLINAYTNLGYTYDFPNVYAPYTIMNQLYRTVNTKTLNTYNKLFQNSYIRFTNEYNKINGINGWKPLSKFGFAVLIISNKKLIDDIMQKKYISGIQFIDLLHSNNIQSIKNNLNNSGEDALKFLNEDNLEKLQTANGAKLEMNEKLEQLLNDIENFNFDINNHNENETEDEDDKENEKEEEEKEEEREDGLVIHMEIKKIYKY